MTVTLDGQTITMTGACGVDEVETLVSLLEGRTDRVVDLTGATAIHTAHWQVLMVFRPKIGGSPASTSTAGSLLSGLLAYYKGQES